MSYPVLKKKQPYFKLQQPHLCVRPGTCPRVEHLKGASLSRLESYSHFYSIILGLLKNFFFSILINFVILFFWNGAIKFFIGKWHKDRTRASTLCFFILFYFSSVEHVKSLLIMGPNNTKNTSLNWDFLIINYE